MPLGDDNAAAQRRPGGHLAERAEAGRHRGGAAPAAPQRAAPAGRAALGGRREPARGPELRDGPPYALQGDEVYFDYRQLDKDTAGKRITIDLAVVTRAVADKAMAVLESWGIAPQRLEIEKSLDDEEGNFDLLPQSARQGGPRGLRRATVPPRRRGRAAGTVALPAHSPASEEPGGRRRLDDDGAPRRPAGGEAARGGGAAAEAGRFRGPAQAQPAGRRRAA